MLYMMTVYIMSNLVSQIMGKIAPENFYATDTIYVACTQHFRETDVIP